MARVKRTKNPPTALGHLSERWALAAIVVSSLPHAMWVPLWTTGLAAGLLAWSLLRNFQPAIPRPNTLFRLLLVALCFGLVIWDFGRQFGRVASASLLVLMLALKLLEARTRRDGLAVIPAALFLLVSSPLFTQSLAMALYLPLALAVLVQALRSLNHPAERGFANTSAAAPVGVRWASIFGLLAQALPLTLVLFLFVPRLGTPLWGIPEQLLDGKTGVGEDMVPGSIGNLYIDDRPALRVWFDGPMPPSEQMYWRGPVLWNFDAARWTRDPMILREPGPPLTPERSVYRYRIELEPHQRRWLPVLDWPSEAASMGSYSGDASLVVRRPVLGVTRYSAAASLGSSEPELRSYVRHRALAIPEGRNPLTVERARAWAAENPDPRALSQRFLNWINTDEFFYSLNAPLLGINGVDEFLFDTRVGYCEYYASAYVVFMRAAGVPARVVTGYQGGFLNPVGEYWVVRYSDAHAWAEIWTDDAGWIRVDPTAAVANNRILSRPLGAQMDGSWLSDLRHRVDWLSSVWNRAVLQYDAARQRVLLQPVGVENLDWRGSSVLMILGAAGAGVLLALTILRRRPRRTDALGRLWDALQMRMQRAGLAGPDNEAPDAMGKRLGGLPGGAASAAWLRRWTALRYGPRAATSLQIKALKRSMRRLKLPAGKRVRRARAKLERT